MIDSGTDLESFRLEVRDWLEANCPAEMRTPITRDADICWGGRQAKFTCEAQKLWLDRMGAKGWTVPEWPAEYGGGGLSTDEAKVLAAEMRRINARSFSGPRLSKSSARCTGISAGASIAMRTVPPRISVTVIRTPSPMTMLSPTRRLSKSMV